MIYHIAVHLFFNTWTYYWFTINPKDQIAHYLHEMMPHYLINSVNFKDNAISFDQGQQKLSPTVPEARGTSYWITLFRISGYCWSHAVSADAFHALHGELFQSAFEVAVFPL